VDFEDLRRGDGVAAADELEAFEFVEGAVVGAFPADAVAGEAFEERGVVLEIVLEGEAEGVLPAVGVEFADVAAGPDEVEVAGLGLGGLEAAELPEGEDEAGGELELDGAGGGEVVEVVALEGVEVGLGLRVFEDGAVGVEAVFEGVGADGEFAGVGDGAGGELGIAAVERGAGDEWHKADPFENVVGQQETAARLPGASSRQGGAGPELRKNSTTGMQGAGTTDWRKWLKRKGRMRCKRR
jgi:hypothetical protein